MAHPDPRGSPKAVLTIAAIAVALVLACDRPDPTAPARAALPGAPSRTLDPGQDYTGDPNDGCWIAPDSSVFEGSPTYGGILPYRFTRCGVFMDVSWPVVTGPNGVTSPLTNVYNGNDVYHFPWGHQPGFGCCLVGPFDGFPWTITFDKAVRNVRVYTRAVDYPGGVVRVKGASGNLIAQKPIPLHPGLVTEGTRDTIAFADTNVYIIEIVPDLDPNNPPTPDYPARKENIGWQAQFEPGPPPPQDTLCKVNTAGSDSISAKAFNDTTVRRALKDMLGRSDTSALFPNRHEEVAYVYKNANGTYRVVPADFISLNQCQSQYTPPLDSTLVAVMHTHPFHDGQVPGCPGAPTKKYESTLDGGGSEGDVLSRLSTNVFRTTAFGEAYQIGSFIMDLDRAWYNPPQALQGERSNKGYIWFANAGCRWL